MFIWASDHEMFVSVEKIIAFWYEKKNEKGWWVCDVEGIDFQVYLTPDEFKRHLLPRINRQ